MTLSLLIFSAFFIGLFIRDLTFEGLTTYHRKQRELRLEKLVLKTRPRLPFQSILSFLEKYSSAFAQKQMMIKYLNFLSRLLERMNRSDFTPLQIVSYQFLLSLAGSVFFGLLSGITEMAVTAFLIGGALPIIWMRDLALKREKRILQELPNSLEILSLCSEAGLTLEQGMDQYLQHAKPGPLKEEFALILEQARTGSSRKNALETVSARLHLTDFSLFSSSLIQAEKFGTGISKTLRQLSLTMRDKQTQRAEKAVQEMPVKMILPLILFIMPVTFLIIFGPILLQFLNP